MVMEGEEGEPTLEHAEVNGQQEQQQQEQQQQQQQQQQQHQQQAEDNHNEEEVGEVWEGRLDSDDEFADEEVGVVWLDAVVALDSAVVGGEALLFCLFVCSFVCLHFPCVFT